MRFWTPILLVFSLVLLGCEQPTEPAPEQAPEPEVKQPAEPEPEKPAEPEAKEPATEEPTKADEPPAGEKKAAEEPGTTPGEKEADQP